MEETNNNTQDNKNNNNNNNKKKRVIVSKSKQKPMPKIINVRRCISCGEYKLKTQMLNIVRPPRKNGVKCMELKIQDGSLPKIGRGNYICKKVACVQNAKKHRRLERSFSQPMAPGTYETLEEMARVEEEEFNKLRASFDKLGHSLNIIINKLANEGKYDELDRLGVDKMFFYARKRDKYLRAKRKAELHAFIKFAKRYYEILDFEKAKQELRDKQESQESQEQQNSSTK